MIEKKAGRFVKGQSGNPKGRPKKVAVRPTGSALDIIVDRSLTIVKNGKHQDVSVEEALQHQIYRKAIDGDKMARREVLKMIKKRDAYLNKQAWTKAIVPVVRRTEAQDPENANEAMLILGIATIDENNLSTAGHNPPIQLELWAVQAAIGRRRGGSKLTQGEINEIKRCTRASSTIKWPRGTGFE